MVVASMFMMHVYVYTCLPRTQCIYIVLCVLLKCRETSAKAFACMSMINVCVYTCVRTARNRMREGEEGGRREAQGERQRQSQSQ